MCGYCWLVDLNPRRASIHEISYLGTENILDNVEEELASRFELALFQVRACLLAEVVLVEGPVDQRVGSGYGNLDRGL